LIIELCRGGELFDELINCTENGWFSERETSQIIRQIAKALDFMHCKDIIHRDLKLENILVEYKINYTVNHKTHKILIDDNNDDEEEKRNNNRRHSECIKAIPHHLLYGDINDEQLYSSSIIIKVSDFGLSKKLQREQMIDSNKKEMTKKRKVNMFKKKRKRKNDHLNDREFAVMATNCGTLYYVAPEILNNEPYNEKVDMWSLGVICYVLLCGSLPFYSENELEISDLVLSGKYDLGQTDDHWLNVSDSAKDLLQNLLTLDKINRYSASKVLSHPFITGQNQLKTQRRKSVKWNASSLLGKWKGFKFGNIFEASSSPHHQEESDYDAINNTMHSKGSQI